MTMLPERYRSESGISGLKLSMGLFRRIENECQ